MLFGATGVLTGVAMMALPPSIAVTVVWTGLVLMVGLLVAEYW